MCRKYGGTRDAKRPLFGVTNTRGAHHYLCSLQLFTSSLPKHLSFLMSPTSTKWQLPFSKIFFHYHGVVLRKLSLVLHCDCPSTPNLVMHCDYPSSLLSFIAIVLQDSVSSFMHIVLHQDFCIWSAANAIVLHGGRQTSPYERQYLSTNPILSALHLQGVIPNIYVHFHWV